MNKRLILVAFLVVGFLIVAFVTDRVMAQGGVSSSNSGTVSPAGSPVIEGAPGTAVHLDAAKPQSSTSSGESPSAVGAPAVERAPVQSVQPGRAEYSTPSGKSPGPVGAPPVERAPGKKAGDVGGSVSVLAPNSPWNTSVRFAGSTLKPRANNVSYVSGAGGGCVYATSGNASTVWNLPLGLSQNAQVEWLRFYYYDNDASTAMRAWFTKYDLYGNIVTEWQALSVDGGNGYSDAQILPPEKIDYNSYSYVLNWRPVAASSNDELCGLRLFYQSPPVVFLPIILKNH